MGVYIYSLRAKTVSLVLATGEKVKANLYSYAYRQSSMWRGDRGYNSYNLTVENTERHANNAFAAERSGVVIVGDLKDGLEGSSVYGNVTASQWWDCEKFPGEFMGWVAKIGKTYTITDRTKWTEGQTKNDENDQWVPTRWRSVFVDGKIQHESVTVGSEADIEREAKELRPGV